MKAFLFDMDGVLVDNEGMWAEEKPKMYNELFGPDMYAKLGNTVGSNMDAIYKLAATAGSKVPHQAVIDAFYSRADRIYQTAPITTGLDRLGAELIARGYRIGIVSASPSAWVQLVVNRLGFGKAVEVVISLHDRKDLPHKPEPHGYIEAMEQLDATPAETMILEDSNMGIAAAKASGAYTIALTANLLPGETQTGADVYADTIDDIIKLLK